MNKKWYGVLAGTLSLSLFLTACGGAKTPSTAPAAPTAGQPVDGGTLTWGDFSDIVTVNPIFIDDVGSQNVANFLFASLYDVDAKGSLAADDWALAAELPQISNGGKTYTIKLKSTPKWSDGQPVTADDLVFSLNMARNKDTGSTMVANYDKVSDVKKIDDHTVQIDLSTVYAPFALNALGIQVIPQHVLKDVAAKDLQKNAFGKDPKATVTDGPYTWKEWAQKQYHTLALNTSYWGPKPHIQTVVYKIYADQTTLVQALIKGEVDMVSTIPVGLLSAVQGKQGVSLNEQAGPTYDYIGYNFNDANFPDGGSPFKGAATRQAITYAINRQGIVDSVLKGHGKLLNGPFLPGSWADAGTAANVPFDAAKAKALLAQDGWTPGPDGILQKNGHKFSFDLNFNSGNARREGIAAIVQQNLKDVGIQVNLKPMDFSALVANVVDPGKFQALLLGWQMSIDPDQESIFSSKYFPPAGQNSGYYKNTKADDLWVQGYSTTDQAARKDIYGKIATEFNNDPPYVFLDQQNVIEATSARIHWSDADKPVLNIPYGYAFHIQNWWVTK
ncbi:MAG: ABC transporter substrate-binding protein [Mycobacterium leprae]